MGESYRGLTIKIGGDTTDLRAALKGVNSALTTTQSHIKKVDKALKLDGGNVESISLKMKEVSERTSDLQSKMRMLRRAEEQLDARGITRLAEAARNSSLEVERMRENFNQANAKLERFNTTMRAIADNVGLDTMDKDARDVVETLHKLGAVSKDVLDEYNRLSAAHHKFQTGLSTAKEVQQFRDLKLEMSLVEAEAKKLARDFMDMESAAGFGSEMSKRLKAVRTAMSKTEKTAEALREELELIEKGLKLDPSNTELAELKMKNLREQADLAADEVDELDKAIRELRSAGVEHVEDDMRTLVRRVEEAEDAYVDLRSKISKTEAEIDDLRMAQEKMELEGNLGQPYVELKNDIALAEAKLTDLNAEADKARTALDTSRAQKELRELETKADAARASIKSLNAVEKASGSSTAATWAWRSLGVTLSSTLTPALMMAAYTIVDTAETFDAAYRDMRKTVQGTEEEFEHLRQSALDYASTHITSADTILEIEAMGGQLGIATEKLEEFAVVVSNLDIATNLEAEELAEVMGQLNNVMDWGEGDMTRFGDALVRLGNNMPALEDAIVDITTRIGAAGTMYGMTTPEVLAWSTAIAATGQNAEAAGTAVSNSLSDIENAVASGGDKLAGFAEVAGMGAEDFARLWEEDASSAFLAFVEGLKNIEAAGGSADVALTELGITGVRQKQALKGLSMTTDVLSDSLTMANNAWNGVSDEWGNAGDAAEEAAKKSEGFSGAVQILRNNLDETKIIISKGATPLIELASDAIAGINDALEGLPEGVDTALIAVGLFVAGVGPLINIATSLKNVGGDITGLGEAFDDLSGKEKKIAIATSLLKGFAGAVALVSLGAVIGEIIEFREETKNLQGATEGLVDAVSGGLGSLADEGKSSDNFFSIFSNGYQSVEDEIDEVIEKQAQLAKTFQQQNYDLEVDKTKLETVTATIETLMEKSNLSQVELAELKTNLELFNQLTGSDLTIDDATGMIVSMGDGAVYSAEKIRELANTYAMTAGLELTMGQYNSLYSQYIDDLNAVAEAQDALNEAQKIYDQYDHNDGKIEPGETLASMDYADAVRNLEEAQAAADAAEEALGILYDRMIGYQTAIGGGGPLWDFLMASDALQAGLTQAGKSVIDFHDVLGFDLKFNDEGLGIAAFSQLTRDQLISLAGAFDGTKESIVASLQQIAADMAATSPEAAAAIQAYLNYLGYGLEGFQTTAAEAGTDAGEAYVDAQAQAVRDGEQDVIDAVNEYEVPAVEVKTTPATGSTPTVDNTAWVPDIEDAVKLGTQVASAFGDGFTVGMGEGDDRPGFYVIEQTAEAIEEAAPTVEDAAEKTGKRASGGFSGGASGRETGEQVAGDIADGLGAGSGEIARGGRSAGRTVSNSVTEGGNLEATGRYLMSGLARGIYGGANQAYKAALDVSSGVKKAMQDALGIHSPSRVAMEIGKYWDEGLAIGIDDEAGYVVSRALDLARAVTSTASEYAVDYGRYAAAAGQAAQSAHSAAQAAQLKYSGPSKADIYDAVSAAIGSNRGNGELAVYIDGRQLASSIARPMDSQLGTLSAKKGR